MNIHGARHLHFFTLFEEILQPSREKIIETDYSNQCRAPGPISDIISDISQSASDPQRKFYEYQRIFRVERERDK